MWVAVSATTVLLMGVVAYLARAGPSNIGVETLWLAPSICKVPDDDYETFVSFVEPTRDDDDGAAPMLGAACPAGNLRATPQEFVLPESLTWAPAGADESVVVFHGEGDSVTLSFELDDANGVRLLAESDVTLGPPPTPRDDTLVDAPIARLLRDSGGRSVLAALSSFVTGAGSVTDDLERAQMEMELEVQMEAVPTSPIARRLLKGGGRGPGGVGGGAHSYGGRTYATAASSQRVHTAVHYSPSMAARTSWGYHTSTAVRAGTFVTLLHHSSGYGRYYDTPGCDDPARGCDLRVEEPLARDAFASNFTMSDAVAFPLTLRLTELEVRRASDGLPTVFLTLYSPTGGVAEHSLSDRLIEWVWVPFVALVFCSCKLLAAWTDDEERPEQTPPEFRRPLGPHDTRFMA